MNTNICTSIEQSKKLLSLGLDPSTADMYYYQGTLHILSNVKDKKVGEICLEEDGEYVYCLAWSLEALLELMPPYLFELERGIDLNIYRNINSKGWHVSYMSNNIIDMQKDNFKQITNGNSLIDAAFEMVCKLIKLGYIKVNK